MVYIKYSFTCRYLIKKGISHQFFFMATYVINKAKKFKSDTSKFIK